MSEEERTLLDAAGDYRYVVRDGEVASETPWQSCRIVLTSRRLVLATGGDERSIPLDRVRVPGDVPDGATVEAGTPVRIGDAVLAIDARGPEPLASAYSRATLHGEVLLVDGRPADDVDGGEPAEWSKARLAFEDDGVVLERAGGGTEGLELGDVRAVRTATGDVLGRERQILAVEHDDGDEQAARRRFSGAEAHVSALARVLRTALESGPSVPELDETDREVLVALYAGVSRSDVPAFVGADAAEVAETVDRLREAGAVETGPGETEVALTDRGRNLASRAMGET